LLLLSNGNTLIAANVSGNDLRSRGRAGAAYIRKTDSTLFASNRCECLAVVNVIVLRPGKAPVAITGNVIVGAEPVHQVTAPPIIKQPESTTSLSLSLGAGKKLTIPVDARALLGTLDRRKNLASDAFSELLADIGTAPSQGDEILAEARDTVLAPANADTATIHTNRVLALRRGTGLASTMLNESTRAAIAKALPTGGVVGAKTLYGHTAGDEDDPVTALRKVVDQVSLHTQDPDEARSQVASLLTASSGDPLAALKLLDQNVLGLNTTKATVQDSMSKVSVIHEVLGDLLAAHPPASLFVPPKPVPPPPPNPADHSLVIIGGTRVAVVGNATTSGILVQEADSHVELNP
jgi:hypothetical protein